MHKTFAFKSPFEKTNATFTNIYETNVLSSSISFFCLYSSSSSRIQTKRKSPDCLPVFVTIFARLVVSLFVGLWFEIVWTNRPNICLWLWQERKKNIRRAVSRKCTFEIFLLIAAKTNIDSARANRVCQVTKSYMHVTGLKWTTKAWREGFV